MRRGLFIFISAILGLSVAVFVLTPPNNILPKNKYWWVSNVELGITQYGWVIDRLTSNAFAYTLLESFRYLEDNNLSKLYDVDYLVYEGKDSSGSDFNYKYPYRLTIWNLNEKTNIHGKVICPDVNTINLDENIFDNHFKYLVLTTGFAFDDFGQVPGFYFSAKGGYINPIFDCNSTFSDSDCNKDYFRVLKYYSNFINNYYFPAHYDINGLKVKDWATCSWPNCNNEFYTDPHDFYDKYKNNYLLEIHMYPDVNLLNNVPDDFNLYILGFVPVEYYTEINIKNPKLIQFYYLEKLFKIKKYTQDVNYFKCICKLGNGNIQAKIYKVREVYADINIYDWLGFKETEGKILLGRYFIDEYDLVDSSVYDNVSYCWIE